MKFSAHKNRFTFAILFERPCRVLVITKAEQLSGDVGKLFEVIEEAVGDQVALLPSFVNALDSSPSSTSLDEDRRDWERGGGGVDGQRDLHQVETVCQKTVRPTCPEERLSGRMSATAILRLGMRWRGLSGSGSVEPSTGTKDTCWSISCRLEAQVLPTSQSWSSSLLFSRSSFATLLARPVVGEEGEVPQRLVAVSQLGGSSFTLGAFALKADITFDSMNCWRAPGAP